MSSPVRDSMRTVSPARSFTPMSASDSSATRSSSARPKTRARRAVLEQLLQHDDLALSLALAGQDHVERLVEDDLVAALRGRPASMSGWSGHPHLAAPGEHVDGAVVVRPEVGPVGRGRLGQLLDLLAQVGDVLLGRLQGEGQLLVLGDGLGQLALGLEELLLEGLHPARALLEPAAQDRDLLLGGQGTGPERLEIVLVRRPALAVGIVEINRRNHLIRAVGASLATLHRPGHRSRRRPAGASPAGAEASSSGRRLSMERCSG